MNKPKTLEDSGGKNNLDEETDQVLELVNSHLGITIRMIASSMEQTKESSIRFITRKLVREKKISAFNGSPTVFFPSSVPRDAIVSISQNFKKVRKEKHGKS